MGIIGIGYSVFSGKSLSVSVCYSNAKIGIGISKVKRFKKRWESVSVKIGKTLLFYTDIWSPL